MADRILGYVKAIYIGGILMGLGYIGLGLFKEVSMFYLSMGFIIVGNGFFKPSISTLWGNLYTEDRYKANKDAGYNIFYMGINIGAFICNIIAAFMRNKFGWGEAFITAGVGMFIGLIIFTLGRKHIVHANILKPKQDGDMGISGILLKVFVPAIAAGVLGWIIPGNIFKSDSTDAFIFACIPVIIFYVSLYMRANKDDKRPIGALLAIFAVSLMFWAVFKQNGTALTRWANYYTDRSIPEVAEKPLKSIYLVDSKDYKTQEVPVFDEQFQAKKMKVEKPSKNRGKMFIFVMFLRNKEQTLKPTLRNHCLYIILNCFNPLIRFG